MDTETAAGMPRGMCGACHKFTAVNAIPCKRNGCTSRVCPACFGKRLGMDLRCTVCDYPMCVSAYIIIPAYCIMYLNIKFALLCAVGFLVFAMKLLGDYFWDAVCK